MNQIIESISITKDATILQALKKMDAANRKLLLVTQDNSLFYGLVSIGDIQRAILKNVALSESVSKILREDIKVAHENDDLQMVKQRMKVRRNEFMPFVNDDRRVVKVIFWEDLFEEKRIKAHIDLPVVIMAGGRGTRLKPITNVLPKPLIPLGEKTILEEIMDNFIDAGCDKFLISVNYKADMIKHYFNKLNNINYKIEYFNEDKPLGTAGSMFLIKNKIKSTFFVTNCDIIIDLDLQELYTYHKENINKITIVSVLKHYYIPYGTIKTENHGILKELIEKPQFPYQINSGMYLLEPEVLEEIPENQFFNITELIEKIQQKGGIVGVFPINEGSWKDIGEWAEYLKYTKHDKQ